MLPINYRWLRRTDVAAVHRLAHAAGGPEPCWSREDIVAFVEQGLGHGLVAEHAGRVVGFLLYRIRLEDVAVRVVRLAVTRRYRRRGIASQLLGMLRQILRTVAEARVEVLVSERNLPAQLLLRANHFRAVGTWRGAFAGGTDDGYLFEQVPSTVKERGSTTKDHGTPMQ